MKIVNFGYFENISKLEPHHLGHYSAKYIANAIESIKKIVEVRKTEKLDSIGSELAKLAISDKR